MRRIWLSGITALGAVLLLFGLMGGADAHFPLVKPISLAAHPPALQGTPTPTVTGTPPTATLTPTATATCPGPQGLNPWTVVATYPAGPVEDPALASDGTYAYTAAGSVGGPSN